MEASIVGKSTANSEMRRPVDGGAAIECFEAKLDVTTAVSATSFVLYAKKRGDGRASRSSKTRANLDAECYTELSRFAGDEGAIEKGFAIAEKRDCKRSLGRTVYEADTKQ